MLIVNIDEGTFCLEGTAIQMSYMQSETYDLLTSGLEEVDQVTLTVAFHWRSMRRHRSGKVLL